MDPLLAHGTRVDTSGVTIGDPVFLKDDVLGKADRRTTSTQRIMEKGVVQASNTAPRLHREEQNVSGDNLEKASN